MTVAMWLAMAILAVPIVLTLTASGCGGLLPTDELVDTPPERKPPVSKDPRARLGEMPTQLPPPQPGPTPPPTYREVLTATPGLLGYWRLGEQQSVLATQTPIAVNAVGMGALDGNYVNPNGIVLGLSGALVNDTDTAARFLGSGGCVQVPAQTALAPDEVTIELWMKLDAAAADTRVLAGCYQADFADNVVRGYRLRTRTVTEAGVLKIEFEGAFGGMATPLQVKVPLGQPPKWHHAVLTYHKAPLGQETAYLYVDTIVSSVQRKCELVPSPAQPLRFAANAGFFPTSYQVSLDEVALYGQWMPQSTVENHYKVATT